MALDFPANPTDGQVYGSYTYSATSGVWKSIPPSATVAITSPTKPTTANNGDIWVNTTTGIAFVYYNDGNTYQWMELLSSAVPTVNEIMPYGTIVQTARTTAPTGWLLCRGQAVSRTTYSGLFSAIGTTYGAGDGSTTFAIPNLQGLVPVGLNASGGTFATLGGTGGSETVTLTSAQIPGHTHSGSTSNPGDHNHGVKTSQGHDDNNGLNGQGSNAQLVQESDVPTFNYYSYSTQAGGHTHTFTTDAGTGGGGAHNNIQPFIILNYMIKV